MHPFLVVLSVFVCISAVETLFSEMIYFYIQCDVELCSLSRSDVNL